MASFADASRILHERSSLREGGWRLLASPTRGPNCVGLTAFSPPCDVFFLHLTVTTVWRFGSAGASLLAVICIRFKQLGLGTFTLSSRLRWLGGSRWMNGGTYLEFLEVSGRRIG